MIFGNNFASSDFSCSPPFSCQLFLEFRWGSRPYCFERVISSLKNAGRNEFIRILVSTLLEVPLVRPRQAVKQDKHISKNTTGNLYIIFFLMITPAEHCHCTEELDRLPGCVNKHYHHLFFLQLSGYTTGAALTKPHRGILKIDSKTVHHFYFYFVQSTTLCDNALRSLML